MLSEGISTARGRSGAYLHRDAVNRRLRGRRGARLAAITSGGAIPDSANYLVVAEPEGTVVGTVDEDFAVESLAGDVFLLGTTSWRIRRVEAGRVRVEDAHGAAPSIPFWRGEAPGRTIELSQEVSALREEIASRGERAAEWLVAECGLDRRGAEQAVEYVREGRAALGALPATHTVVAERFFDEGGGMQLVLHAPFGARINRAWGLALRKRFCRSFNFELQAAATDNGIVISLGEQHSFPLDVVFEFLRPETAKYVLTQAMLDAPMFGARWRWNATRALAILRFAGGRKVPPPIQRMRADDLMAAVFPDQAACAENLTGDIRIPDHPLVKETIDNCLYEAMDLEGLTEMLRRIEDGRIRTVAIDTAEASPFSHEILNANPYAYLDDAPLEERRARAVQLRRTLRTDVTDGAGALDRRSDPHRCGRGVAAGARRRRAARSAAGNGDRAGARGMVAVLRASWWPRSGRLRWTASGSQPKDSTWCGAPVPVRDSRRPSRRRRFRARCRNRARRAWRKSCGDGSNAPSRCVLPNWRAIWRCRATWWRSRWRSSKRRDRFCAGIFSRAAMAKSSGRTGGCWRAYTGSRSGGCGAKSSRSPRRSLPRLSRAGSIWRAAPNCTASMACCR